MENIKQKCSSIEHDKIDAVFYCQECKVYLCNKCENFHSKLLMFLYLINIKLFKFNNIKIS